MVRKLAVAFASLGLTTFTSVYALGLGEIELHSALNQPLNADIKLHSVRPGELDGIKVGLASAQAFQQAGLDRPHWLSQFKFKVDKDAAGQPLIRVTSSQPVREPFVTLLVDVNWTNGRIVREYTLLLDPPEFAAARQDAVMAPRMPVRSETQAPATTDAGATPPAAAASPAGDLAQSYGPVKSTDTLWSIASRMRPDASVSVEQMMLALVRANPEAFEGGNVNRLKRGYVLRAPQASDLASLTRAEALREVQRQNAAWRELRRATAGSTVPAPAAAPETPVPVPEEQAVPPAQEQDGPRLKLVPATPEEPREAPGVIASAEVPQQQSLAEQSDDSLQQQLALANETAAARQQENEDLRARLAELERQMADVQRLIELKDNEIAALQSRLQEVQQRAEQAKPTPKPAAHQAPASPAEAESGGLLADLLNSPLFLLLGALVVLVAGALAWVAARRRRMLMESRFQESILMPQPVGAASGASTAAGAESTSFLNDSMISDVGMISAEMDETDPLAEADIYMAYGRYQQAEELIGRALEKEPERTDLKAKMLEIHYATKDKKSFEALAQDLRTALGDEQEPVWNKIAVMGRELCPESPLFADTAAAADAGDVERPEEELALLAGEAPLVEEDFHVAPGDREQPSDNTLEFDLDFQPQETAPEAPEQSPSGMDFHDLDMEFEAASGEEPVAVTDEASREPAVSADQETVEADGQSLEFDTQGLDWLGESAIEAETSAQAAVAAEGEPTARQETQEQAEDPLATFDEVGTKLDLAKVYIDMGDADSARSILNEVLEEGNGAQRKEAQDLLQQVS